MKLFSAFPFLLTLATALPQPEISAIDPKACPGQLHKGDVAPLYIIPVSLKEPRKVFGSVFKPLVSPRDVCTWFAFDVPPDKGDSICALHFLLPLESQLTSSSYSLKGSGNFTFGAVWQTASTNLTPQTSWETQPQPTIQATQALSPGGLFAFSVGSCPASSVFSRLFVRMCSEDTNFEYFQNNDQCPIGLWVSMYKF